MKNLHHVHVNTIIIKRIMQDPEGSHLLYTISGDYFSVNPNSGEITLIKVLLITISLYYLKIGYSVS